MNACSGKAAAIFPRARPPGGDAFPAARNGNNPRKLVKFAGVVVAGISSPGVFRRNATAGLPVNGIYPLIPIQ